MMTRPTYDGRIALIQGSDTVTVTGLGLNFTPNPQEITFGISGDTGLVLSVTGVNGATADGFTVILSGLPDSGNYVLTYFILAPAPSTITPVSISGVMTFPTSLSALSGQTSFTIGAVASPWTGSLNLPFTPRYAEAFLQSSAGSAYVGAIANTSTLTSAGCTFNLSGALPDGTYTAICKFYY